MTEKRLGKQEMSTVEEFSSKLLRERVAPIGVGLNVSDRIRKAASWLGWSYSRTKDIWYQAYHVSVSGEELVTLENYTGVRYGRAEIRTIEQLIASADALLDRQDSDFHGPTLVGMRAFLRALAGPGTERRD